MYQDDLIQRAVASATHCEEQGFHETAKSLRALAEELRISATATMMVSSGFSEAPAPAFRRHS